jgi:hypothetical protein
MEFIFGAIVGFVIAGLIGRAKFLTVQTQLREAQTRATMFLEQLYKEINLNDGLSQELAGAAKIV